MRPYPFFTLWHCVVACLLIAFSMDWAMGMGYSEQARAEMDALVDSTRPGYVLYNSKAAAIGDIWNITPENENAYKEWW